MIYHEILLLSIPSVLTVCVGVGIPLGHNFGSQRATLYSSSKYKRVDDRVTIRVG